MGVADLVLDNPILIKHLRSQFRRGQVLPSALVVLLLSGCVVWATVKVSWFDASVGVTILLGLQIVVLTFVGASRINTSLGGARESGILDFHRVSPLPPSVVALGFFLGAPIREYLVAALILPFALYCAADVDPSQRWKGLLWIAQLEVAVLMSTWVFHAIAMLGCLLRKKARGRAGGFAAMVFALFIFGYSGAVGIYFGARWALDEPRTMTLFGVSLPWLAWMLLYEAPALGFLGLAAARKMRAERTHSYTKPQALACMATLIVLVVGGLWDIARFLPAVRPVEPTPADAIMLAAVYVLSIAAMVLAATITPDSGEYVKGLRRAGREGRRRPGPWSDAGSNRLALFALCAFVLAGAVSVVNVVGRPSLDSAQAGIWANDPSFIDATKISDAAWKASRQARLSRPIAIGVLSAASFGLAFQYFSFRTRRSGPVLTALFLVAAWLLPMLASVAIALGGPTTEGRALTVLALSPVTGIALSSGLGTLPGADAIPLAALAPSLTFAFVFNYLLVVAQRNVDRRLLAKEKPPVPDVPAEDPRGT